jgi:CRP-like cAMP-binding protein
MEPTFLHDVPLAPPKLTPGGNVPLELLRHQPFCNGLTDPELAVVAKLMRPLSYEPGEFIFHQGTEPDGMYVLETGEVLMWTRVGDMRREIIRFQPGSMLCLASVVETGGRLASMEVLKTARAWVLDIRAFNGLLAQKHPVALRTLMVSAENMGAGFARALHEFTARMVFEAADSIAPADPWPEGRPATPADLSLLKVLPFGKAIPDPELETLTRIARWYDVKRGHRLLVRGGAPSPLLLVVRGALEALFETKEGKKRLSMRGPGLWAGVDSFSSRIAQPYTVVVRENALLLGIERAELDALYSAQDPLAIRLLQEIAAAIQNQFNHDLQDLLKAHTDRGSQASISSDEMMGRSPRPSM